MQALLEEQRVGAEVDVFLACDEARRDFRDLRMHQRLAARDAHDGRAALLDRAETFLGRQLLFQDVRGILNFSAAGAGEIAAKQRLEHQDERILLASFQLLADDVGRHRPHLRYGSRYAHCLLRLRLSAYDTGFDAACESMVSAVSAQCESATEARRHRAQARSPVGLGLDRSR